VYQVHDWAEVRRLRREERSIKQIAEELGMSRTTVYRLLSLRDPPRYVRRGRDSLLDPFREQIAALLDEDERAPATVILERLRERGYAGGITILKEHLSRVRPEFLAARTYQRTTYLPGDILQLDWWQPPIRVAVGLGHERQVYGLVATLPHSAAHACVFAFGKTLADLLPAFLGCLGRLGGVPRAVVADNDPSLLHTGYGRRARLHDELAALFGHLSLRAIILEPARPESKGQVERTNKYLEGSFLPLRHFRDLADLQAQMDIWTRDVAFRRHHRRVGDRVGHAWAVETRSLAPLPEILPDTDRHLEVRVTKDAFVRVAGRDYSVPPGLARRRVGVRLSPVEVRVFLEGREIAHHERSYVPADVVTDPDHARLLRLAQAARLSLAQGDVPVEVPDLARYDALLGAAL
jgi:transposase